MLAILNPSTRSLGPIYMHQLQGAVMGAPLPLGQSLMIAWPQIVGLVAATILLFVIGYMSSSGRKSAPETMSTRLPETQRRGKPSSRYLSTCSAF